jgi:hypothetical protein
MASTAAPEEPGTGAVVGAPVVSRPTFNPGWGLVILGGLLGVLGAFLTWATVDYGGLATHTYRGVSAGRDGKITVVLAVLVVGIAVAALLGWFRGWMRATLAILGLVIAFIAIADIAASPSVGSEEQARLHVTAQVTSSNGVGEWLTLVAGILVVVGVVLVGRYSRASAAGATAIQPTGSSAAAVAVASGSPEYSASSAAAPTPEQSGAEASLAGETRAHGAAAERRAGAGSRGNTHVRRDGPRS